MKQKKGGYYDMCKVFNITNEIDREIAIIFCNGVLHNLQNRVTGFVSVMIVRDTISIEILNGDAVYRFICDDIMKKIYVGCSSDDVANIVVRKYKNALIEDSLKKYFC